MVKMHRQYVLSGEPEISMRKNTFVLCIFHMYCKESHAVCMYQEENHGADEYFCYIHIYTYMYCKESHTAVRMNTFVLCTL